MYLGTPVQSLTRQPDEQDAIFAGPAGHEQARGPGVDLFRPGGGTGKEETVSGPRLYGGHLREG